MGIGSPATERSRDRQLKGKVFNSETKCSMWAGPTVTKFDGRVSPSAAANTNFEVGSGEELLQTALRKGLPRSPSKPLRAASPPRAQQARIARLSPPPHADGLTGSFLS